MTTKELINNKQLLKKKILINIIITTNIKILNKKYRKKNKQTDILTFKNITYNAIHAEIFINTKFLTIKKQNYKKVLMHGILHLLNYTHDKQIDYNLMKKLEHVIGMSGIEPPTITTSK